MCTYRDESVTAESKQNNICMFVNTYLKYEKKEEVHLVVWHSRNNFSLKNLSLLEFSFIVYA